MAYKDIREFIRRLEEHRLLKRIKTEVTPELEITEIVDRVSKSGGPALLFENVKGYNFPVLINSFGSMERMNLALEVDDVEQIAERIRELLRTEFPTGFWSKLTMLPKLYQLSKYIPQSIGFGNCKEVIVKDNPSLDIFPILQCWPYDAGRFITLPLVFTHDPDTGRRNVGMYRMQVYDSTTTGMHWHIHKHGAKHFEKTKRRNQPMQVAVVIGSDPATIYSATAPLPDGFDEILFAGFLRKEPVKLVKCETIDIEVPANAEIVLEGYVNPGELRNEGPFGDHTGYYSEVAEYPVFHLNCITHRRDAIYTATVVGKPPMEDCYLAKATERIFLPLLKLQVPEIVDIHLPIEGVFHNCVIVSINKSYPGHAKKVMHALWGLGQTMFSKIIIVVDAEVNVHELSEVSWKLFNNVDPSRDLVVVEGPLDSLDHSSELPHYGHKLGIDGTRKGKEEGRTRGYPREIKMSDEIKRLVDSKWMSYGIE